MGSLIRLIAVAQTTFRETIRNKVMLHLVGFALAMLALGWVVSNWSLGEPAKVVTDIGLSVTALVGCAIALFSGIVLVWGEVEQRTVLPILAKPLPRWEFVIGKFFGFSTAVILVYVGMNIALSILLVMVGAHITPQVLEAMYLSAWEVILVIALALLFSSFSTPTLSAIFTVTLFVAGRFSGDLLNFIHENPLSDSRSVLQAVYAVIPHLAYFNLRVEAVHSLPIIEGRLLWATVYGVIYCSTLLGVATVVFRGRDLA